VQDPLSALSNNKYAQEQMGKSEKLRQDPILELSHIIGYNG